MTLAIVDRFSIFFTFELSRDRVMNWLLKIPSHLKGVDTLLCECKCRKTADNMKQMFHLTINFNHYLLQLIMFVLICECMVNIKTVIL